MILMPDPNTAVIDPFLRHKTLILNCFVARPGRPASRTPATRGTSPRRPRST